MGETEARGTYLVECYWPSVTEATHAAAAERARAAAEEANGSGTVQFLGSLLVPAEETVFCLFAGTEDDVRVASAHAELPFERILKSVPAGRVAPSVTSAEAHRREAHGA